MRDFSVKKYLIDNKLVTEDGKLITTDKQIPSNTTWGLGPYASDRAMIYLCTTIYIMDYHCALDNLDICITTDDDLYYDIHINEIDRAEQHHRAYEAWDGALRALDFLVPHMASSNTSYLAGNLFYDT